METGGSQNEESGKAAGRDPKSTRRKYPNYLKHHPKMSWDENEAFNVRWDRAKRYWLTATFEFVWLAGVIVFAAMPWLRNAGRLGWSIHWGLIPILLYIPWFFGYAQLTFSSLCPAGGIVYPWVISPFGLLPWTEADLAVMKHVPTLLEPLSQLPGSWFGLLGFSGPGPFGNTGLGVDREQASSGLERFSGESRGTGSHRYRDRLPVPTLPPAKPGT